MSDPRVSVILPAYNCAATVGEAVASVVAQSFPAWELIVVNDGSTDATAKALAQISDSRVRVITHDTNQGLVAALRTGITEARAPLLARQDADDRSRPERFAQQVAFLDGCPEVALLGTAYAKIDADGLVLVEKCLARSHDEIIEQLQTGNPFCHGSVMMRRAVYDAAGGYRDLGGPVEDLDLWLRMTQQARAANLPDVLYEYRTGTPGIMACRQEELALLYEQYTRLRCDLERRYPEGAPAGQQRALDAVRENIDMLKAERAADAVPESGTDAERMYRHAYVLAEDHWRNGNASATRHWLLRALWQKPFAGEAWRFLSAACVRTPATKT